ncbi:hypothetical protein AGMMS50262_10580 [Bacteroidia bacterium]|nr:hypothetical protein AGMMS50262_10580 [Bacteroidia bacterium]
MYEGSIAANTVSAAFQKDILLKPGEQLTYNKNNSLSIITIGGTNDIKWKDGIFYFKKQTLQSIVRGLERNFNVSITIEDEKLAKEEFTGDFENAESLTNILEILKMTKKTKGIRKVSMLGQNGEEQAIRSCSPSLKTTVRVLFLPNWAFAGFRSLLPKNPVMQPVIPTQ